jgi:hypothetical protein
MRVTAPFRSKPHRRRGRASIATLVALSALAAGALTLAPTTATAMDDNGGAGECRSFAGAPPGAGWNGTEFCTLTDGSAGGGGGGGATGGDGSGAGSGSGGGTVGEVIVIVDPYSPPKSTNPLCPSRHLCLPGQSGGGRPLGYADDGRNPREPKGRGAGPTPTRPSETPRRKPKPLPLTKEECRTLKGTSEFVAPFGPRMREIGRQLNAMLMERQRISDRSFSLNDKARVLRDQLNRLVSRRTPANTGQILTLEAALLVVSDELRALELEPRDLPWTAEEDALRAEKHRLEKKGAPLTTAARKKCKELYGDNL